MGSAASTGDKHKHEVYATLSELINKVEVFQNMLTGEVLVLLEEDALDFLRNTKEEWYIVPRSALQHDYNVAKLSHIRIKERGINDVSCEEELKSGVDILSGSSKLKARSKFEKLKEQKNLEILKRRNDRSPKESTFSIFNNSATPSPRVGPRSRLDDVTSPSERFYKEETRQQANKVMQKLDEQRFRKERKHLAVSKPPGSSLLFYQYVFEYPRSQSLNSSPMSPRSCLLTSLWASPL